MYDYAQIDRSMLVHYLFYPRTDVTPCPKGAFDHPVPVDEQVAISCRFYEGHKASPWILYFHGNGEVASDYDEIAPSYHRVGTNLVVADYRGYGSSGGRPNFSSLMKDAHTIFSAVRGKLQERGCADVIVMGRSLGSISALEIAAHHADQIKGLIVESGFASVARLVRDLGIPSQGIDLASLDDERVRTIQTITCPTLILHGELDALVPLREAKDLYPLIGSGQKKLIIIPGADHNNIIFADPALYFGEIGGFIRERMGWLGDD